MTNRKETIKWIALFVAIVLLFAGVGTSLYMIFGHKNAEPAQQEQVEQKDDEKPVENNGEESALVVSNVQEEGIRLMFASAQPKFLASTVVVPESVPVHSGGAESDEAVACISQNVTATITPATVVDKYVTWSVAWDSSAALKNQDISQYVTVTQENEGDLTATINCFKSFKGSKIILTCTTRQGNKKATAEVQFQGVPSSMTINSPSGVSKTKIMYNVIYKYVVFGFKGRYDFFLFIVQPIEKAAVFGHIDDVFLLELFDNVRIKFQGFHSFDCFLFLFFDCDFHSFYLLVF